MKTKKLKEGIILFHGSAHAQKIQGSIRGPGWFTTALKSALHYATEWLSKEKMEDMKPGILVYEVARPVNLYVVPESSEGAVGDMLGDLLVEHTGILTWREWEVLERFERDWSSHKWDLNKIRKSWEGGNVRREKDRQKIRAQKDELFLPGEWDSEGDHPNWGDPGVLIKPEEWFDDMAPEATLMEKMERLGIDGVVGAIRALCKADPNFHGWALNHGSGWEVMLCEPTKFLKRKDLWDLVQVADAEFARKGGSYERKGWRSLTPSQRVGRRCSATRVARRYQAAIPPGGGSGYSHED